MDAIVVFEILVTILAILANAIVLPALVYTQGILPGYRRFLISLSSGDIYISVIHLMSLFSHNFMASSLPSKIELPTNVNDNVDDKSMINLVDDPNFNYSLHIFKTNLSGLFHLMNDLDFSQNKIEPQEPWPLLCINDIIRTLKLCGFLISLLNLVGMSIDNFIGVYFPVKYHYVSQLSKFYKKMRTN